MKKIRFLLPALIATFFSCGLRAQTDIKLPPELSTDHDAFEFSSLAEWNDQVLLVPTLKD